MESPMKFTMQFFGGILVGLAFGLLIGAALVQGTNINGGLVVVGLLLVFGGFALARQGSVRG
jgi:NhaP-type Na+/H+ or K+/H+ antiporter